MRAVRPDFEADKKGTYADIDTKDAVARVTVRDSGEYEQMALEPPEGRDVWWKLSFG